MRQDADAVFAVNEDRTLLRDPDDTADIAIAAEAAQAESDRGVVAAVDVDSARHVDAAGATATAQRLGQQAARAVAGRPQVRRDISRDVLGQAAVAAETTHAEGE